MEKKEKKKNLLWLWILLGCIGLMVVGAIIAIILVLFVFYNSDKAKTVEKLSEDDKFVETVYKAVKDGSLKGEFEEAIPDIKYKEKVKLIGIDFDNDSKKELIAYYTDSSTMNNLITFEVDTKKNKVESKEVLANIKDESGLKYAYSIEDDKNYWVYEFMENEYFIKGEVNKVIKEEEFNKNYYVIKDEEDPELNNVFDDAVTFVIGSEKISKEDLKGSIIDNKKILEEANLTEEQLIEKAKAHRDEIIKVEEEKKKAEEAKNTPEVKPTTNTFTLNGKTMHYGKYKADPVISFGVIEIMVGGKAVADGANCTWTFGSHDFAQDESSAGHPVQSLDLSCPDGKYNLTSFKADQLEDGGMLQFSYVG